MRTRTSKGSILAGLLLAAGAGTGRADPTWPAPTDQMEEIVFQLQGMDGSLFSDNITPCDNEAAGPGRVTASEWLRVAFHDMATHNRFFDRGGLDGSLQFELRSSENTGPGHNTTLQFYATYLSSRSSLADLIAAGAYAAVRACGGPVIPLRLGRKDALTAGSSGVPQPENSVGSFVSQFDRMGFSQTEMIQVVACGHTLGGVHRTEFPNIIPAGVSNIPFDTSKATFDNRIATEYVSGNTTNPLVVGPAIAINRHSDFKVFNSDGNATISTMTSPSAFQSICQTVLQKMIDVVPSTVTLTPPIAPYTVKPQDMQLTLQSGGASFLLTGKIRVRTTEIPGSTVTNLVLTWKDRNGGNSCGSLSSCSTTATLQGIANGFDDTFAFFPIEATIPTSSGISSFTITINRNDGSSQTFDNNGNTYPLSDAVVLQKTQSCLLQTSGQLTVAAVVRNDVVGVPVNLDIEYQTPRTGNSGNPVPAINTATVQMTEGDCIGPYTFYSASYTIPGGRSYNARISITAGEHTDDFNKASIFGGTCGSFTGTLACGNVTEPVSTTSSATASSTSTSVSSSVVTTTTTSSTGVPTPSIRPSVGGYNFVDCWTEGAGGIRALGGASFAYDEMTLESCAANCTGFDLWGTEYGRECYCGNSLHSSSSEAPEAECNMPCGGDPSAFCGAGNRIQLYSTTATRSTSATPTPTATLSIKPTVGAYVRVGCQTEASAGRALSGNSYASDDMTLESCAAFCSGFTYFGTQYSRECFCGNTINGNSAPAPDADCSMTCAGDPFSYCGAGNRLELYILETASTSTTGVPPVEVTTTATATATSTTSAAPTGTLSRVPTVSPYSYAGCYTEGTGSRALTGKSTYDSEMTLEFCAGYCSGYKYMATQYSAECFCGNTLHSTSTEAAQGDCSMTCAGNEFQYCGGPNRLELYVQEDVEAPAAPSQPETVGNWTFYQCRTEGSPGRALAAETYAADTMTLESCADFCAGYTYFGTEYARECFCGNSFGVGSIEAPAAECSMTCAGNGSQFCGAGNRLSIYQAA
ncbi:uncharacterized protein QC763_209370 [Podospora pseudopauciseta]|uniref:Uncharacterized protein n=1 Tax=Podospora pseudopauciseta TaxID=2093780 RepID=A0ABR0HQK7_9PEZI|nr:hypothetical protein QC763_209370 [Podospora pseudopauciseta]